MEGRNVSPVVAVVVILIVIVIVLAVGWSLFLKKKPSTPSTGISTGRPGGMPTMPPEGGKKGPRAGGPGKAGKAGLIEKTEGPPAAAGEKAGALHFRQGGAAAPPGGETKPAETKPGETKPAEPVKTP